MGTPHRVINPATKRRVLKKGKIGRQVTANAKKKQGNKPKKTATVCRTNKTNKGKNMKRCNVTPKKKKGGPVPGKFYGFEGATKYSSPIVKRAGKTKNYASRPSARACFDSGDCGPVCYGGHVHVMAFRANGSPYWKKA